MPILNALEFVEKDLTIHYRGSAEPQELVIEIETAGLAPLKFASLLMKIFGDAVRFGAAGSSLYAPSLGRFDIKKAPVASKTGTARKFKWVIDVAGIAPIFLRVAVEILRASGYSVPVKSMSIVGSLPPDRTRLTVNEADVAKWLDDPSAYPEQWPTPAFPLTLEDSTNNSVSIILSVGKPINPKLDDQLKEVVIRWNNTVANYVDVDGNAVTHRLKLLPKFGHTKTQFRAAFEAFIHVMVPARNVLINMLDRFHHEKAPIAATIAM